MTHADKVKEFYREQGRTEEQERIIKLLNSELSEFMWQNVGAPRAALGYANTLGYAIALIKGTTSEH
jgi:hypothetical protein